MLEEEIMARKSKWTVTSAGNRSLKDVRQDLLAAGFDVEETMDAIGVITGRGDAAVAKEIAKIDGVSAVEAEGKIDIGPPGKKKTW
jgi:hypothetical protein